MLANYSLVADAKRRPSIRSMKRAGSASDAHVIPLIASLDPTLPGEQTMAVSPIPPEFNSVSAYLIVPNAVDAMAFYEKAFGAKEVFRMPGPDGQSTMHAEVTLGDSKIMLTDENPQWNLQSALTLGGSPVSLHLYVEDCDALFQQAVAAGCEVVAPLADMFWGDRFGKVKDPYGIQWSIASVKEEVPPEEMAARAKEAFKNM